MDYLIIELRRNEALFARFQEKGKSLLFQGGIRKRLDHPEALVEAVQEFVSVGGRERIILAIDPAMLSFRELTLPIKDRRKLREILPLELKGSIASDPADSVFDSVPLHGGRVLAVWANRPKLAEIIGVLTAAGGEPAAVTASPLHWERLLPEGNSGDAALTDGETLAAYRDREPLIIRHLGESDQQTELSRSLMALEIARNAAISQVQILGKSAGTISALKGACSAIPLPVAPEHAAAFKGNDELAQEFAAPYAVVDAARRGGLVDFRSGSLAYTADTLFLRKKLRLTAILAGVLLLLLAVDASLRYFLVKRDLDSVNGSIRKIYRELFPDRKKPVDEVAELRAEIRRLGGAAGGTRTLPLLREIASAKGDDVTGIFEAEFEGEQVRLKGEARSFQAVQDLKGRLSTVLDNAEVSDVKSRPDGTVTFACRGTVKGGEQ